MIDQEIKKLEQIMKNKNLYWIQDNESFIRVISITERIYPTDGVKEPSLCANLNDGTYLTLYCCELVDFVTVEKII
jgi:hypothetical protein